MRAGHRRAHILDTTTRSLTAAGQAIQSIPARNCKNMASLPVPEFVSWCSLVSAPAKTFSRNQDPQATSGARRYCDAPRAKALARAEGSPRWRLLPMVRRPQGRLCGMTSQSLHRGLMDSTRLDSQNHIPGIGIISITSTVAPGIVRCGLLAKRAAAASCDSACTME